MAASSHAKQSDSLDSRETTARAKLATATDAELEAKMPESIKQFSKAFTSATRAFSCPECGTPSTGTCDNCGYTHAALREDSQ